MRVGPTLLWSWLTAPETLHPPQGRLPDDLFLLPLSALAPQQLRPQLRIRSQDGSPPPLSAAPRAATPPPPSRTAPLGNTTTPAPPPVSVNTSAAEPTAGGSATASHMLGKTGLSATAQPRLHAQSQAVEQTLPGPGPAQSPASPGPPPPNASPQAQPPVSNAADVLTPWYGIGAARPPAAALWNVVPAPAGSAVRAHGDALCWLLAWTAACVLACIV